ncbi:VOC family protein [Sedimenticola sp.]|uniref:VOC family protein n=1 Tax=Sedimenticola sp. TaxID=1940285 RepID=UPI003D0B56FF
MQIEPYLYFEGCAEQAAHFYQTVLGAEILALLRYSDSPDPTMCPEGGADKVMHMNLKIGDSIIMGSDGRCTGQSQFQGFALTLNLKTVEDAQRRFDRLAEGGEIQMPMAETFFSPAFGMLTDRFGVPWMVLVQP